jgi:magnesium transporter
MALRNRRRRLHNYNINQDPGRIYNFSSAIPHQPAVFYTEYSNSNVEHTELSSINDVIEKIKQNSCVSWLDVRTVGNMELLNALKVSLNIHPLVLEDIQDTDMRPKMEDYGHFIFVTLKTFRKTNESFTTHQVSLIIGSNYVISFQDENLNLFTPIYERLNSKDNRLHLLGADYLAYSLIDLITDQYSPVLDNFSSQSEDLNNRLINDYSSINIQDIYELRRDVAYIRKEVTPSAEIAQRLYSSESVFISNDVRTFFSDTYDHVMQTLDIIDYHHEMASELMVLYHSIANANLNEVIKTLTIISTIFIPLTFIAGVYGMNFRVMPELEWPFGYPLIMIFMGVVAFSILFILKRKKWL